MGLTATFITCRAGAEPAAVGLWTPFSDVAEGWVLRRGWKVDDNAEGLAALLGGVVGPALAAFVMDSDFCVVMGALEGTVAWRWVFNEQRGFEVVGRPVGAAADPAEDPDAALAAQIRAVVPRIAEWSRAAGLSPVAGGPLEELLECGYILAEEGLFVLLVELGVCGRQAAPVYEEPVGAGALQVGSDPPAQSQLVHHGFFAALIDHRSRGWQAFVRTYEQEAWGEPPALVVEGQAIGGGPTLWDLYLASDPPVFLGGLGFRGLAVSVEPSQLPLDWDGHWVRVPDRPGLSRDDAIAWARANVGVVGAPPAPNRERLWSELLPVELHRSSDFEFDHSDDQSRFERPGGVMLRLELDMYQDLLERADGVAAWLEKARDGLFDPVAGQPRVHLTTKPATDEYAGEPYGLLFTLAAWTIKQRLRLLPGDANGWARLLGELRRGRLREVHARLDVLNGQGMPSQLRFAVHLEVVLRDQFVDQPGPLPDGHPARIVLTLGEPSVHGGAIPDLTVTALALAKHAAARFRAAAGYVAAGRDGFDPDRSPYEDRVGSDPLRRRPRLDRVTRGAHWGTFLSAGHLEQIGGVDALRDLGLFHTVERLAGPPDELVWAQLTPDPYRVDQTLLDRMARALAPVMPPTRVPR
jgi:hypothetical protein